MRVYFDLNDMADMATTAGINSQVDTQLASNLNSMMYQPITQKTKATLNSYVRSAIDRYCQSIGFSPPMSFPESGQYTAYKDDENEAEETISVADLGITDCLNRTVTYTQAPDNLGAIPCRGMGPIDWENFGYMAEKRMVPTHWEESTRIAGENPIRKCSLGIRSYDIDFSAGQVRLNVEVFDSSPFRVTQVGTEIIAKVTMRNAVKRTVQDNLTINVKTRVSSMLLTKVSAEEMVALETLREMVSESEFRKYVKDGFILVRGDSGRVYQVFRNRHHSIVWYRGKVVEEVCVRIRSDLNVPPTDNVIAFKVMIEANEEEFRNQGNVYRMAA